MKARRLPGVRCSKLNTECRSLLCLMIMPGRSWVAGIDIAGLHLLHTARNSGAAGQVDKTSAALGINISFYTGGGDCGNGSSAASAAAVLPRIPYPRTADRDNRQPLEQLRRGCGEPATEIALAVPYPVRSPYKKCEGIARRMGLE